MVGLLLVVCFGSEAKGQGTAAWAATFPKTGTAIVEIDIKGTITPAGGWTVSGARWEAWETGGEVLEGPVTLAIDINTGVGTFDHAIGLTTGKTYNVVVTATMTSGAMTKRIRTAVGSAKAK
jgi:hypothetical protein